jgi:hypothetical protein
MSEELDALQIVRKTGRERFHIGTTDTPLTLLGFWQWSNSDLVGNALRGVLAEYIGAAPRDLMGRHALGLRGNRAVALDRLALAERGADPGTALRYPERFRHAAAEAYASVNRWRHSPHARRGAIDRAGRARSGRSNWSLAFGGYAIFHDDLYV